MGIGICSGSGGVTAFILGVLSIIVTDVSIVRRHRDFCDQIL